VHQEGSNKPTLYQQFNKKRAAQATDFSCLVFATQQLKTIELLP
jgi:hypothetical protein